MSQDRERSYHDWRNAAVLAVLGERFRPMSLVQIVGDVSPETDRGWSIDSQQARLALGELRYLGVTLKVSSREWSRRTKDADWAAWIGAVMDQYQDGEVDRARAGDVLGCWAHSARYTTLETAHVWEPLALQALDMLIPAEDAVELPAWSKYDRDIVYSAVIRVTDRERAAVFLRRLRAHEERFRKASRVRTKPYASEIVLGRIAELLGLIAQGVSSGG
jgi:hypothetical protein